MGTLKPQSNGPLYSNTVIGTLAVAGWTVTFGIAMGCGPSSPLIAVPNVTVHPATVVYELHIIRCDTRITLAFKGKLLIIRNSILDSSVRSKHIINTRLCLESATRHSQCHPGFEFEF